MKRINVTILTCVLVAVVAMIFRIYRIPGGGVLYTFALFAASITCIVSFFKIVINSESRPHETIAYFSMALGFFAILLTTMFYPHSRLFTYLAGITMFISLFIYVYTRSSGLSKSVVCAMAVFIVSCINYVPSYKWYPYIVLNPWTRTQDEIDSDVRGNCYLGSDYAYYGKDSLAEVHYRKAIDAYIRRNWELGYIEDDIDCCCIELKQLLSKETSPNWLEADSMVNEDIKKRREELEASGELSKPQAE